MNVRIREEDLRELKRRAVEDCRFWHSVLRDVLHGALRRRPARVE